MVWVRTRVRPRSPRRGPKNEQNDFFVISEGQIHIFPMVFDGQHCGFERSLGVLGGSQVGPGGVLGAPELALGGLGGVPGESQPHLEAPRRGLGTDFGDPKKSACVQNTHIYIVF